MLGIRSGLDPQSILRSGPRLSQDLSLILGLSTCLVISNAFWIILSP